MNVTNPISLAKLAARNRVLNANSLAAVQKRNHQDSLVSSDGEYVGLYTAPLFPPPVPKNKRDEANAEVKPLAKEFNCYDKLKCIQYRSYTRSLVLYHYHDWALAYHQFKEQLDIKQTGYVEKRWSNDPLSRMPIPKGDELPFGRLDVVYLPRVFSGQGSAIGFRTPDSDRIEWLCFAKPAHGILAQTIIAPNGERVELFEHVADLQKSGHLYEGRADNRGVKGDPYHRETFEALEDARICTPKLKLLLKYHNWNGLCNNTMHVNPKWGQTHKGGTATKRSVSDSEKEEDEVEVIGYPVTKKQMTEKKPLFEYVLNLGTCADGEGSSEDAENEVQEADSSDDEVEQLSASDSAEDEDMAL
jgi:hypothetical protein